MKKNAKMLLVGALMCFFLMDSTYAQKPAWVDNPGVYASENFVGVGVAKDSKADKARDKAEKKAKAGIEKILKSKYPKKDVKASMSSIKIESYWQDPMTKYYYALALLPIESIDKNYAAQKKADKARSSAMGALKMLNAQSGDSDVSVMKIDDDVIEPDGGEGEMGVKTESDQSVNVKKEVSIVSGGSATAGGTTDFGNKSVGSFKWSDQDQNSKYSLLGDGNMTINVATGEGWDPKESDKRAPRVEMNDIKGDFAVIAKVKMDWEKYYNAGFGIGAHSGKQNVRARVHYNGNYVYLEGFANDIDLPRTEKNIEQFKSFVFLKLVRSGYSWTAFYSTVDDDWIEIASFDTEFPQSCNVGAFFVNDEGTTVAAKVEFVRIVQ